MCSGVWLVITLPVTAAMALDVWQRRIPNWITIPYLVAGVAHQWVRFGIQGLTRSMYGILVAIALPGVFWLVKGMGLGDVKLLAAIGAWLGPGQTGWILDGFGGRHPGLRLCVVARVAQQGVRWHGRSDRSFRSWPGYQTPEHHLDNAGALSMSYAPAIAIGTWFSFLMKQVGATRERRWTGTFQISHNPMPRA